MGGNVCNTSLFDVPVFLGLIPIYPTLEVLNVRRDCTWKTTKDLGKNED